MFKKFLLAFLDHFEGYVCQIILVFFVCILMVQIILRGLNHPLSWTEEVARYSFLWFVLLGACYATRLAALNRVTMQFSRFPPKLRDACLLLGDFIWLCFCLAMAWYGYLAVVELVELPYYTPALDWNLSHVYIVFPFAFLLMAVRIVQVNYIKFILKEEIADADQEAIDESKRALVTEGTEDTGEGNRS